MLHILFDSLKQWHGSKEGSERDHDNLQISGTIIERQFCYLKSVTTEDICSVNKEKITSNKTSFYSNEKYPNEQTLNVETHQFAKILLNASENWTLRN